MAAGTALGNCTIELAQIFEPLGFSLGRPPPMRWRAVAACVLTVLGIAAMVLVAPLGTRSLPSLSESNDNNNNNKPRRIPHVPEPKPRGASGRAGLRIICSVIKNEARYLQPWLDFHLNDVGFDRIYLYDDHSTDDLLAVVSPYADRVLVVPVDWTYIAGMNLLDSNHTVFSLQADVVDRCVAAHWEEASMMVTIDTDEFWFPCRSAWSDADPFETAMEFHLNNSQLIVQQGMCACLFCR